MQFAVYTSDTPATLKPRMTDYKQGNNHAKLERSRFNGVREKANVTDLLQTRYFVCYIR